MMADEGSKTKLFALSTCGHCRNTKRWLAEHGIDCEVVDVDLLHGEEKKKCLEEMREVNPRLTFPTIVMGDGNIIIGYHPDQFEEAFLNGKEDA
jgi:glutaredoxin-like protein NrdH